MATYNSQTGNTSVFRNFEADVISQRPATSIFRYKRAKSDSKIRQMINEVSRDFSNPDIHDPNRRKLNLTLFNHADFSQKEEETYSRGMMRCYRDILESKGIDRKKIRSNSNRALEFIATLSPQSFEEKGATPITSKAYEEWVNITTEFFKKHLGEDRILTITLHLDEGTPHIHCIFLPIEHKYNKTTKVHVNSLCSRNTLSYTNFNHLRDTLAKKLEPLGIESRIRTQRTHINVRDLYTELQNNVFSVRDNKIKHEQQLAQQEEEHKKLLDKRRAEEEEKILQERSRIIDFEQSIKKKFLKHLNTYIALVIQLKKGKHFDQQDSLKDWQTKVRLKLKTELAFALDLSTSIEKRFTDSEIPNDYAIQSTEKVLDTLLSKQSITQNLASAIMRQVKSEHQKITQPNPEPHPPNPHQ